MKQIIPFIALCILCIIPACAQDAPYKNPSIPIENRVSDLLSRLTLEEKIDLLGGTGFATKKNDRLGIPELRMSDGPLGVRWEKSTAFPSGICIAATWNPETAQKIGAAIGRELKGHDRHVILGPCVNIARIPQGGRNFESYGEDPFLASRMTVGYINGVQSEGVAATVKHFACNNQEYERMYVDTRVEERALREIYLPAFKAAVQEAKVYCVMNAYNKINGFYAAENDFLLKDVLKNQWGFTGLVMSDWGAVHSTLPTALGGMDLEMPLGEFLNSKTLSESIQKGIVKESIIDEKVKRILRVIFSLGLFEKPSLGDSTLLGSKENRNSAFEAAREGIVLLKNDNQILPLDFSKLKSLAVLGPNAVICRTGGGGSSMVDPLEAVSPLSMLEKMYGNKMKIHYASGVFLEGDAPSIESNYLRTENGEQGLLGEYYPNRDLEGKPSFTRVDPMLSFEFGEAGPKPDFPKYNYSIRWTGKILSPQDDDYSIEFVSDDGVRLWLDGNLVIDNWNDHAPEAKSVRLPAKKQKEYQVKIEYYQHGGGAVAKLGWFSTLKDSVVNAVNAAKQSDAVLLFVGTTAHIESEGFDRENLVLPKDQERLIREVVKANKNTVVVLNTGSPVLMDGWINNVKGIVQTWFGGQEMSKAIIDVISGVYNPSGKLPMTFPHRWEDCSAYPSYKIKDSITEYTDGIYVGYRHFEKKNISPLFPFGFGLSYTTFQFSDLKTNVQQTGDQFQVDVTLKVANAGKRDGAEIVQVYVSEVVPSVDRPIKELKAFKKVMLRTGDKQIVQLLLKKDAFSYYDVAKKDWIVNPGKYAILVGNSSTDIRLKSTVEIK